MPAAVKDSHLGDTDLIRDWSLNQGPLTSGVRRTPHIGRRPVGLISVGYLTPGANHGLHFNFATRVLMIVSVVLARRFGKFIDESAVVIIEIVPKK